MDYQKEVEILKWVQKNNPEFRASVLQIREIARMINDYHESHRKSLRFIAWDDNKRKMYSSASDPVKISLDGKCINTITGQELKLYQVEDHKLEENIQKLKNENAGRNM